MQPVDALFFLGRPFSPLYGALMRIRAWLYSRNILGVSRLPVPVISVGNLTMGGTGKTPTVQMLSRYLQQNGYRPAVVSRGYGGSARMQVNVVSTGKEILLGAGEAGDEPYMLASTVPGLPVLTGKKRALPCWYACTELQCDIIILDDGFQHLAVQRDLDIVLFNAANLDGCSHVFPGGELREPFTALRRADVFLLTGITATNRARARAFESDLGRRFGDIPVFTTETRVAGVFRITGEPAEDGELRQAFLAFSGIAHPERFLASLAQQDIRTTGTFQLKDHARYNGDDMAMLVRNAMKKGATALITTQKDSVKLKELACSFPLYYLAIEATPSAQFIAYLNSSLTGLKQPARKE